MAEMNVNDLLLSLFFSIFSQQKTVPIFFPKKSHIENPKG